MYFSLLLRSFYAWLTSAGRACRCALDRKFAPTALARVGGVDVDDTPSPRRLHADPPTRDSVDIAVESGLPKTRPVSQLRLPERVHLTALIPCLVRRQKKRHSASLDSSFTRSRQVCSS